jgi:hypothetical protein
MSAEVGVAVSDILDRAAKKYIKRKAPDLYRHFQWQVHGAGAVRQYDGSDTYWRRVQATLDFFFTCQQRAEAVHWLLERANLSGLPECRCFLASAFAERRLAELMTGAVSAAPSSEAEARNRASGAWDPIRRSPY